MNTVQGTQEKRTIKVKEFLDDFRSGMADRELQSKYHLTQLGLEKFYSMLMERGIVTPEELQQSYRGEEAPELPEKDLAEVTTSESSFICPRCLASHQSMFDICPSCGVSFQEMIDQDRVARAQSRPVEPPLSVFGDEPAELQAKPESELPAERPRELLDLSTGLPHEERFCCPPMSDAPKEFGRVDDFARFRGGFDDSSEEIVSGMPYVEASDDTFKSPEVRCEGCEKTMEPGLRDVYDRGQSLRALMASGAAFLLGFLASAALLFFSGQSIARLVVVYATGMFLLFGTVLLAVGAFLFLAKERVYCCPSCRRVYPRS